MVPLGKGYTPPAWCHLRTSKVWPGSLIYQARSQTPSSDRNTVGRTLIYPPSHGAGWGCWLHHSWVICQLHPPGVGSDRGQTIGLRVLRNWFIPHLSNYYTAACNHFNVTYFNHKLMLSPRISITLVDLWWLQEMADNAVVLMVLWSFCELHPVITLMLAEWMNIEAKIGNLMLTAHL